MQAKAERRTVSFKKGTVLTAKMLETAAEFPLSVVYGFTERYSDGFVAGFDVYNKKSSDGKNSLVIRPGVIKYKKNLYVMSEEIIVDLPEEESGTRYFCFFKCNESKECENVILNSLEFVVSKDSPKESDIMFCTLKPNITGLSLPQNIKQVNDNSAVNLKPCRYSGLNGQCLHPYITRIIKEAICKKNDKKPEDYILLGALFASETLSQDAVRFYLNDKGSDVDMIIEKIGKKTENALQEVDIKEGYLEAPKLTIL